MARVEQHTQGLLNSLSVMNLWGTRTGVFGSDLKL